MILADFGRALTPTTVQAEDGKFHPGVVQSSYHVWRHVAYWENVRFATEDKAAQWAAKTIEDAANAVVETWNLTDLT